jgi:hypothetical protein
MRKKEEILNRIKDLEEEFQNQLSQEQYHEIVGKIKTLNWVLNPD